MKLILPTGPDGADREYPADDLVWSATLSDCQALLKHTGMDQDFIIDQMLRFAADKDLKVTTDDALMRAHMGMVWLARYVAGERDPDGQPLTLEDATRFSWRSLRWRMEPGDAVGRADPPKPSARGGRKPAGGTSRSGGRGKRS